MPSKLRFLKFRTLVSDLALSLWILMKNSTILSCPKCLKPQDCQLILSHYSIPVQDGLLSCSSLNILVEKTITNTYLEIHPPLHCYDFGEANQYADMWRPNNCCTRTDTTHTDSTWSRLMSFITIALISYLPSSATPPHFLYVYFSWILNTPGCWVPIHGHPGAVSPLS